MNADDLLRSLRDDADEGPLARLVGLLVDDLLTRPMGELVDPPRWADIAKTGLSDWLASDRGEQRLKDGWREAIEWLGQQDRTVGDVVPAEIRAAIEEVVAQPYAPDPEVLRRTIDREPVRKLLREILHDTLVDFGRKVSSPVAGASVSKGLGSALGGLGRGAGDRFRKRAGVLGALAEEAIGAVGSELEKQLDRKATEFADGALSTVIGEFVRLLSDPARSDDQAAIRKALLVGVWDWSGPEAAAELGRGDPDSTAQVLRRVLTAWVQRDDFDEQIAGWLTELLYEHGHRTLGDVLDELDLLDSFRTHAGELARQRAQAFVGGDAFGVWLRELAPETP